MEKLYVAKTKENAFMIGTKKEIGENEVINEISGRLKVIVPAINLFKDLEEKMYSLVHVTENELTKNIVTEKELKETILDLDIIAVERISLVNYIFVDYLDIIEYIQSNIEVTKVEESKLYITLLNDIKFEIIVDGAFTPIDLATQILDIIYGQIEIGKEKPEEEEVVDVTEFEKA